MDFGLKLPKNITFGTLHNRSKGLPIKEIQEELAQRWQAPVLEAVQSTNEWPIIYKLTENDRIRLIYRMQNAKTFRDVMSRTILLYKKGDEKDLKNLRPPTIDIWKIPKSIGGKFPHSPKKVGK